MKKHHQDIVLETAASDAAKVHSLVAASWARSLQTHQLQPNDMISPRRYESGAIAARREALSRVIHVSQAMLDHLHKVLSHSGCSIFLCDADGVILTQRIRDADLPIFDSAGLTIGADWSEASQGTNGIGTCIVENDIHTAKPFHRFSKQLINLILLCYIAGNRDALSCTVISLRAGFFKRTQSSSRQDNAIAIRQK